MAHVTAPASEHSDRVDGQLALSDLASDGADFAQIDSMKSRVDDQARGSALPFAYAIQLDTREPQDERALERLLQLVAALPRDRMEALVVLPFADAVRLLTAALPAVRGADELVGPFFTTKGLAERWRISEQAVHKRADKAHKLLKVMTKDDVALYPAFQFDATGGMLPHLAEVREALSPTIDGSWTVARWLRSPSTLLSGRAPADLLRAGDLDRVLNVAASFRERLST